MAIMINEREYDNLVESATLLNELLTAAEIIDGQDYPPDADDVVYLGDVAREVRDFLIKGI